jgi:hypothetical protein
LHKNSDAPLPGRATLRCMTDRQRIGIIITLRNGKIVRFDIRTGRRRFAPLDYPNRSTGDPGSPELRFGGEGARGGSLPL